MVREIFFAAVLLHKAAVERRALRYLVWWGGVGWCSSIRWIVAKDSLWRRGRGH